LKYKLFFASFFYTVLIASGLHVPINDPIYPFLDRLAVKGVLTDFNNNTLPLTRNIIAKSLIQLKENRGELTPAESSYLNEFLSEYRYELTSDKYHKITDEPSGIYFAFSNFQRLFDGVTELISYSPQWEEPRLMVYEKDGDRAWLNIGTMMRREMKEKKHRLAYTYHYDLSVSLGEKFSAFSSADLHSVVYNDDFAEESKEFKGGFPLHNPGFYGYSTERSFEYAQAYLNYSSVYGEFTFANEPIQWGNALQPIILSDNVPPYPRLAWSKSLGKSRFSFFHANILPAEPSSTEGLLHYDKKYLVGHRWEVSLSEKFEAAFTEMLVYGGRETELIYFIPPIFLWPVQHNMTSQSEDNILWFLEAQYSFPFGLKTYGTFMIDELRTSEMFNDWGGNRWAVQAGAFLAQSLYSIPVDFRLEFTAVRPWAYTHRAPQFGTYTHNTRPLGFASGPNSRQILFQNIWWTNPRSQLELTFTHLLKGLEPDAYQGDGFDYGNDANDNYSKSNPEIYAKNTGWLIGDIQITNQIHINYYYQLSNAVSVDLGVIHLENNGENETTLLLQLNLDY